MMTTAQQFSETLKEIGVRYVFGVPSGSMIDYIDAIRKTGKIDFILVSHEASAGFMAYVCGRLTGIPGACFATFGPGATNLSTGVGGALLDRAPLLAFTDEIPKKKQHRIVQMNIDHQALFKPITKWTTHLKVGKVRETLLEAARVAGSGIPGPVHIGIPSDISNIKNKKEHTQLKVLPKIKPAEPSVIQTMQEMFSRACKPLVVLGITAVQANVKPLVHELIEKYRVPVVLTPMAKGMISEDHPLYAGVLNHAMANIVGQTHQQADLILGIGYDPVEVNYEDWAPDIPILHINIFPADLDTDSFTLAVSIAGDIKTSLQALIAVSHLNNKWDMDALLKQKFKMFAALKSCKDSFGPLAVLEGLRKILPSDGIMTCDVGAHLHLIGQKRQTPEPGCLLMTNGWSSMGFAIPAAIAAKLCCPEKKVACVVGDGGFLMTAGEMATARRLDLHIIIILLSDQELSLIRIKQKKKNYPCGYGTRLFENDHPDSDFFLGVPIINVSNYTAYKTALQKAFACSGPVIIKAAINSSEYDDLVLKKNK